MADKIEMLPGTVATRGCEPFRGYSEDRGSAVKGRGNPDITKHRFCSTMSAVLHLQNKVNRAASLSEHHSMGC